MKNIIAILLAITLLLAGIPVYAEDNASMDFDKAVEILMSNNRELKKLKKIEEDAFSKYQVALRNAETLDINGITIEIKDTKIYKEFDAYTKMLMIKKKELVPEQTKFDWDTATNNLEIKKRNLIYGLRSLYLELEKSYLNKIAKDKSYKLEVQKNQISVKKYSAGLISNADFDEAEYSLNSAKKNYDIAIRNWENSCRSISLYIGLPINSKYNSVNCEQYTKNFNLEPVNNYIQSGIGNRTEILSLSTQIKLMELDLDIIKRDNLYEKHKVLIDELNDGLNKIEEMNLRLDKAKYDVEYEIRTAYTELTKEKNVLKNTENALKSNRQEFIRKQSGYKIKLISKLDVDAAEIKLLLSENQYKVDVFNYNTKIMKFKNAIGLGPAYK